MISIAGYGIHEAAAAQIVRRFEELSELRDVAHEIRARPDGLYLVFQVVAPTERLYACAAQVQKEITEETHPFYSRIFLAPRSSLPKHRLDLPEAHLLRQVLSRSLTADQHSHHDSFFEHYIQSVVGAEEQVVGAGNHLVYGRRGAGKSTLLAYAMRRGAQLGYPSAWVNLQAYSRHADIRATTVSVLQEVFLQFSAAGYEDSDAALDLLARPEAQSDRGLDRIIPRLRAALAAIANRSTRTLILLDDLHLVPVDSQAQLLHRVYSITRGNRSAIKASGIEHFTRAWDAVQRIGLEAPHDASVIRLDYNLTMPDKSLAHLRSILDAHARYCGLPNAAALCGSGVLERLVWVSAGVPRDALEIFSKAITTSKIRNQARVSVTSVNISISEATTAKERYVDTDASGDISLRVLLDQIKAFCISTHQTNAFLVEIKAHNAVFAKIEALIALRMLHVLHEGITPHKAGRRYIALMLDYGFYVGIRAAKSVDLFESDPRPLQAKALRKLKVFPLDSPPSQAKRSERKLSPTRSGKAATSRRASATRRRAPSKGSQT